MRSQYQQQQQLALLQHQQQQFALTQQNRTGINGSGSGSLNPNGTPTGNGGGSTALIVPQSYRERMLSLTRRAARDLSPERKVDDPLLRLTHTGKQQMKLGRRVCSNLDVPFIGSLWDRPIASDEWPVLIPVWRSVHMTVSRYVLQVSSDEQVYRWLKQTAQGVDLGVIDPNDLTFTQKLVASDWRVATTTRFGVWTVLFLFLIWAIYKLISIILFDS